MEIMLKNSLIFVMALLNFSVEAQKVDNRKDKCGMGTQISEQGYFCGKKYQKGCAEDKIDDLWSACRMN